MKRQFGLLLLLTGLSLAGFSQQIEFNKKSGEFSCEGKPVAKLISEKLKGAVGKNYIVTNMDQSKELIRYNIYNFVDTFGGTNEWYYTSELKTEGLNFYHDNFNSMLNTFREVGEHVVAINVLNCDGSINAEVANVYAQNSMQEYGDLGEKYKSINDSLIIQTTGDMSVVSRNKKASIELNDFGKIGQDNKVIGSWQLLVKTIPGVGSGTKEYTFLLKNANNVIVAVSKIELGGATTYYFNNGASSKPDKKVLDIINNNPISNETAKKAYIQNLAYNLIKKELL
ncbi:MAG: hypothetical protein R2831_07945 [Chitinophagaceae bacterium]